MYFDDITAKTTIGTDNEAPAYAGSEKQDHAGGAVDIGIIELKMLISAIKRVKYD